MRPPFVLPGSAASFDDYFRLTPEADRVAAALGYDFARERVTLPQCAPDTELSWVAELQQRLQRLELRVNVGGEQSRREFFIAPVLIELAVRFGVELRSSIPSSRQSAAARGVRFLHPFRNTVPRRRSEAR